MFYAVHSHATGRLGGVAGFLRIALEVGSIEVGHIALSPDILRTVAATEAIYLMMARAFGAGHLAVRAEVQRAQPRLAPIGAASWVQL